jgi:5S rRNA maturation endonuclease (ribonuclease M5)
VKGEIVIVVEGKNDKRNKTDDSSGDESIED